MTPRLHLTRLTHLMPERSVFQQIVDLVGEEPGLTLSGISRRLGRNPGAIRGRLIRLTLTRKVVATIGPDGWTVYHTSPTPKEG